MQALSAIVSPMTTIRCMDPSIAACDQKGARRSPLSFQVVQPVLAGSALAGRPSLLLQISQLHPADLSRDRLRQLGELHAADALVRRELLLAESEDLARGPRVRSHARLERHERLRRAGPYRIGAGHDGGLGDRRMLDEHA